jgi:hypothetical protein
VIALDLAHQRFLPRIVLALADHLALVRDPVCQNMNVLMLGVGVPGHDVLVVREPHALQILAADGAPLGIGEVFAHRRGQRHVQHCPAQFRAQLADLAELR